MAEVLCLGEILVDWVCTAPGAELGDAAAFTKAAGGAPANVAVGLARLGVQAAFIGRISSDAFGLWLKSTLEQNGVDTDGVVIDTESQTRMAYVVTTESGDRKLAEFSRIAVADANLSVTDLKKEMFAHATILHFGSISLINEPSRSATLAAIDLARGHEMLVSYDPNVRLGLWDSAETCRSSILETLKLADILKINVDELEFLTGSRSLDSAVRLQEQHNISIVVVTLDSSGAFLAARPGTLTVQGLSVQSIESTGAGDGFVAGLLTGVTGFIKDRTDRLVALSELALSDLELAVVQGNAVGALTCTKPGAIPALPTQGEVKTFLETLQHPSLSCFPL